MIKHYIAAFDTTSEDAQAKIQDLRNAVANATSYAGVFKNLDLKWSGGSQTTLKNLLRRANIDTSHFLGEKSNCGENHKGGAKKLEAHEVLVEGKQQSAHRLRRSLKAIGREYKCEICGLPPVWNGQPLLLQIDHKDGNKKNNKADNLRFLCPCCHTQTTTWGRGKADELDSHRMYYRRYRQRKKNADVA